METIVFEKRGCDFQSPYTDFDNHRVCGHVKGFYRDRAERFFVEVCVHELFCRTVAYVDIDINKCDNIYLRYSNPIMVKPTKDAVLKCINDILQTKYKEIKIVDKI